MSSVMHRGMRMAAFLGGLLLGVGTAVFAYSNTARVEISWARLHWSDVPLGLVALVPLLAGVAAGYLYHLPARMHHFSEHMRHRALVHHLEKENKELRHSLDKVLEMPDETAARALPATAPALITDGDHLMEAEPVVVHQVRHKSRASDGAAPKARPRAAKAAPAPAAELG